MSAKRYRKFFATIVSCCMLFVLITQVSCQLPDDIQRELNQNLAEQARIQALRQQHQRQIQSRTGTLGASSKSQPNSGPTKAANHDPNNYSYQQVSPPIQYSYYQPFGDAVPAQQAQPMAQRTGNSNQAAQAMPANFDLNNLNFDLPQPQAQVAHQPQQQHLTPSFTGAGGLPVMRPLAPASQTIDPVAPVGNAPLAPQARVQQGPPLTEADFKDITGGENYGAPGGNDFGLGEASSGGGAGARTDPGRSDDAQLAEFGMPVDQPRSASGQTARNRDAGGNNIMSSAQQMSIPDFGSFNPIGAAGGNEGSPQVASRQRSDGLGNFGDFGAANGGGDPSGGQAQGGDSGDFDFASQPSSNRGGQATNAAPGGAPGSLQSLLGSSFPGLGGEGGNGGGNTNSGLDQFAGGGNDPMALISGSGPSSNQLQQRRAVDDGALDIADLGEKSDQFSGADLGGFEQPSPQRDQDFNYAAESNQQPASVPYPDGNPQPVGTLFAITQPQSLTQTRYSASLDKGTYQEYPAYQSGGNNFDLVSGVVDRTPPARRAGQGRYSMPSSDQLAPEHRVESGSEQFDYANKPNPNQGSDRGDEAEFGATDEGYDW